MRSVAEALEVGIEIETFQYNVAIGAFRTGNRGTGVSKADWSATQEVELMEQRKIEETVRRVVLSKGVSRRSLTVPLAAIVAAAVSLLTPS